MRAFSYSFVAAVLTLFGCLPTPNDHRNDCQDQECGGSGGEGGGEGVEPCTTDRDCSVDWSCAEWECSNGSCTASYKPFGTLVSEIDFNPGDCQMAICDGEGEITYIADDTDVGGMFNTCMVVTCQNGERVEAPAPETTVCWGPDNCCYGHCDGAGACLRGTCMGTPEECAEYIDEGQCGDVTARELVCRFETYP